MYPVAGGWPARVAHFRVVQTVFEGLDTNTPAQAQVTADREMPLRANEERTRA